MSMSDDGTGGGKMRDREGRERGRARQAGGGAANAQPGDEETEARPQLSRKDLLERVVARMSGTDRAEVRKAMDAVLSVIAEGLESGHDLQLPPLGKLRRLRAREKKPNVLMLRLSRGKEDQGLADAGEGV